MNSMLMIYGAAACGLLFFGLEHVNEKAGDLRTINVSVPSSGTDRFNVQQFYPVLAEGIQKGEIERNSDINLAFYERPPEPEVSIVDELDIAPETELEP